MIVANSAYEEITLKEDFPTLAEKVVHVEEAIDIQELETVALKPEKPQRILYIGNLLKYKNIDKLLLAFSRLPQPDGLRLVIVGDGPEGDNLKTQAQHLNIEGFVEWKSRLSRHDLLNEYARASIFVNLSRLESFGRTVMEALYVGLPAVVAKDSAISTATHKGNVKAVDPANAVEIAESILECLQPTSRSKIAGDWVDWDTYVSRMVELYDRLPVKMSFHSFA
jgi:glycosyltransferase involved in cell wall biosynthesis